MSFGKFYKKISNKPFKIALFVFLFLGFATFTFAQISQTPSLPEVDPTLPDTPSTPTPGAFTGTVRGFAWMGTGIQNPNASEGGGGWLKFNCSPDDCSNNWGVKADMNPGSSLYGVLQGQAWSNNYGWLDFSDDVVQSCWQANPSETFNGPAKILFPTGKVVGWAKFLAGDDLPNDGWDGCVSFSGVEYGVSVNLTTGVVSGWAWGSSVVGWISFQNPECPFCNVTIVLDQDIVGCMDRTATNYNPLATVPGRCHHGLPIRGCMDPLATNYNPLATIPGRCIYSPTTVLGCTNPLATNYNPLATVDDGTCRLPSSGNTTLTLNVNPDTFTVGQPNVGAQFIAGPTLTPITWNSNNPSAFVPGSCQGTFSINGLTATNLTGWTGLRANPNSSLTNVNVPMAATASAGTYFRFTITCTLTSGGTLSASDQINMIDPIDPPTEPPSIWLHIEDPNTDGSLVTEVIPPWNTTLLSGGVDPLTLRWQALNVVDGSCLGESVQYIGANAVGANSVWDVLPLGLDFQGYGTLDLNVTSQQDIRNTRFQIKCHPLNAPTTWISAQVCMRVDGQTFPQSQCSAGNSINRPPGYKEI